MGKKEDFFKVDRCINDMASTGKIKSFYPQTVSRKLNIQLEIAMAELMRCVELEKIHLRYEIRCLDDLNTIKVVDSIDGLIGEVVECSMCGEEFEITPANIYLKFFIDEGLIKENKKKNYLENDIRGTIACNDGLSIEQLIEKCPNVNFNIIMGDGNTMSTFNNSIGTNQGTINNAENGDIKSTNTINQGNNDLQSLIGDIEKFQKVLCGDIIHSEEKEEIADDIELLKEEIVKDDISKGRINRIIKRITTKIPNLVAITGSTVTLLSNFENIKLGIEKLIT